jgi:FtsH-binding integral membrane protein
VEQSRRAAQPGSLRARIEQASRPTLVWLTRLPRLLVPAIFGVLVIVALATPTPIALVATLVVVVFVGWLTYLSWPAITPGGRVFRLGTLGLLVAYLVWLVLDSAG